MKLREIPWIIKHKIESEAGEEVKKTKEAYSGLMNIAW